MSEAMRVRLVDAMGDREIQELSEVLIDCVEGGASVGFMLPLSHDRAVAFWRDVAASAARGRRQVIVAQDESGCIVGTVQVVFAQPENQPHRADIAKMLVHRRARRHGLGAVLLAAAEQCALEAGRTLLVLDTANHAAARLYERGGWQWCGRIPDFALWPDGGPCATTIYFKSLGGPTRATSGSWAASAS